MLSVFGENVAICLNAFRKYFRFDQVQIVADSCNVSHQSCRRVIEKERLMLSRHTPVIFYSLTGCTTCNVCLHYNLQHFFETKPGSGYRE